MEDNSSKEESKEMSKEKIKKSLSPLKKKADEDVSGGGKI